MADALGKFMAAIRSVESGGDYNAQSPWNPGYGRATGAYQFLDSTWGNYKGYKRAMDAPREVQDERARQMMAGYYKQFGSWQLVAVAWHGGPGAAQKAQRDPNYIKTIRDTNVSTYQYVQMVMGRMGKSGSVESPKPKSRRDENDSRPWSVPRNLAGKSGKIVVNEKLLLSMTKRMTEHLAITESVYHTCRDAADNLGRVRVGDAAKTAKVRHALEEALEDWEGVRRLPPLLSRDIGYLIEARQRALRADDDHNKHQRGTIERIIASMNKGHSKLVRSHVRDRLRDLFRPDTPHQHKGGDHKPTEKLSNVNVHGKWGGAESVFDQFITPFLAKLGLTNISSEKRDYDSVDDPNRVSDHFDGSKRAYAIDYLTNSGRDEAEKLAKAMGIQGWRPDTVQNFVVKIDGAQFRVQIIWGAAVDHGNHVHVGLRRI
ncbi:MAG TPA: transglycosylase SLT domain-containing protein [Candidatus Limnocylindrales bacterium]